jgi:hypothetical protein
MHVNTINEVRQVKIVPMVFGSAYVILNRALTCFF